jgi:hypothetical protein
MWIHDGLLGSWIVCITGIPGGKPGSPQSWYQSHPDLRKPKLAWALDRTKNYFLKIKEMAIYIKGKYILLSSIPLFFKHP